MELLSKIGPYNEVAEEYDATASMEALKELKVLVIGAGGLGCEILKNLSLTGFKKIHVIDMDTIDISNLNRQFLFRLKDVGKSKAEVAAKFVESRTQGVEIVPQFCKIQDKPLDYYKQFVCIICGLDSVEARRWINATLVTLAGEDILIPLIDGGTEGFKGQSRVIFPSINSCYECTLDLVTPKITYPVCTIATTPRLPEHCIEWANEIEWPRIHNTKFDADNPDHVEWMYQTSLARAKSFNITGVTKLLTLGVVKNIIPAIASTNAIIAASCCNEAFKLITNCNPMLDDYMMYSGDESIFTYTYKNIKKSDCPVCGNNLKVIKAENWWNLEEFIDEIKHQKDIQMTNPSLSTKYQKLYFSSPESLRLATQKNLHLKLSDLVGDEEIIITDPKLPISLRVRVVFN